MTVNISHPSPQLRAVLQFYDAITNWKFDFADKLFDDDYISKILPSSTNDPPKNKAQGLAHLNSVGAELEYTPLKYEIFQLNESKGNIWVNSEVRGEGPGAAPIANESIYIFTLKSSGDEDNVKITEVQEFIDTKHNTKP